MVTAATSSMSVPSSDDSNKKKAKRFKFEDLVQMQEKNHSELLNTLRDGQEREFALRKQEIDNNKLMREQELNESKNLISSITDLARSMKRD